MDIARSIHMRLYLALSSVRDREDGQAMVEYALILFLVSVVSIAVLTLLGQSVSSVFSKINQDL